MRELFFAIVLLILFIVYKNRSKLMKLPRGLANNNPGNIIKTKSLWVGEIPGKDTMFKTFKSIAYGYRAIFLVLVSYIKSGNNTIRGMINAYAPPGPAKDPVTGKNLIPNNTPAYITEVARQSGTGVDTPISATDYRTLTNIVATISRIENGLPAKMSDVENGLKLYQTI